MGGLVVRESVTLAGVAERVRVARGFVAEVLGSGHPCGDEAVLLVSELFGNSVRHSGSGASGETVTVAVRAGAGVVRVEVTDRSGPGVPRLSPAAGDREGGRGLALVAGLALGVAAARWADGDLVRTAVWAARPSAPAGPQGLPVLMTVRRRPAGQNIRRSARHLTLR